MLMNFAGGGAAICVLAREAGAGLAVVDAGVIGGVAVVDGVRVEVVDDVRCTDDLTIGPAMPWSTAIGMIERGIVLAEELAAEGVQIIGLGEMGIANTTSASPWTAALLPAEPSLVSPRPRNSGIDDEGFARKVDAVRRGLAANGLPRGDAHPADVVSAVGGLEIAFLVGVTLGAAGRRIPVLLDGFVSSVAGLVAIGFRRRPPPRSSRRRAARTRSRAGARQPGLEPLLDLGLRLGEGTGVALALPLVRSAIGILTDMATFDAAGAAGPPAAVDLRSASGDA